MFTRRGSCGHWLHWPALAASFFLICPHCHLTADLGYTGQTVFTEVETSNKVTAEPPGVFAKSMLAAAAAVEGK